nr:MAG TPA: hypothetical protein [Caudoviricetes sp.]
MRWGRGCKENEKEAGCYVVLGLQECGQPVCVLMGA